MAMVPVYPKPDLASLDSVQPFGRPAGRFVVVVAGVLRGLPTGRFAAVVVREPTGRPTARGVGAVAGVLRGLPTGRFAGALGADGAVVAGAWDVAIAARMVRSVASSRAASAMTRRCAERVAASASASETGAAFCFFPGMIRATLP